MRGYQLLDRVHQQVLQCRSQLAEIDTRRSHAWAQQVGAQARLVEMLGLCGRASASQCADAYGEIVELLRERARHERYLREVVAGVEVRIQELVARRRVVRRQIEEARVRHLSLLEDDAGYRALQQVRVQAEAELANISRVRDELGASYAAGCAENRRDWRFRYLIHRRYTEPEYAGPGLLRRFDRWLARMCAFRVRRSWERTLDAQCKHVQPLVDGMRAVLDRADAELAARERTLSAISGLAEVESELVVRQCEIDDAELRFADAEVELAAYGDGADRFCRRAHALAAACIGASGLASVTSGAAATPAEDADGARLVELVRELDTQRLRHRNLTALQAHARVQFQRVRELERDLLEHGALDTAGRRYSELDLDMLLPAYMGGVLGRDDLVRAVVPAPAAVSRTSTVRA